MVEELYPSGPSKVRPDLTRPTAAYRRHAYIAGVTVLLFLIAYAAVAAWFAWSSYHLLSNLPHSTFGFLLRLGGGVAAAFMAILMIKAVFFIRRGDIERDFEITPQSHPRLFAFLNRLADEAHAPRPHRVFLSPRVNAGVYYDLSIANLLFPSKKNIEIGLGLVNVLTLSEFKAVLAHELGHFAQRTMALSRWVYIAQQIVGHVIVKRDAFDRFLIRISNIDVRIAWIGWGLRIVVWSIRSVIGSVFGRVVLAQRALGREMELQADLVAVSLTGSDAFTHALFRSGVADEAMDQALSFVDEERNAGRTVADMFAIQSEMIVRMRAVLDDASFGSVPPLPTDPAPHRLFKAQFAQPPQMWSTHPPLTVREENAKREYVAAPLDDRSAWALFEDPDRARTNMTRWVYARLRGKQPPGGGPKLESPPIEESMRRLAKQFDRRFFDAAYRGMYLGRSCVRSFESVPELYGPPPTDLAAELAALYPATLKTDLERCRDLTRERAMLRGLERGILETSGKLLRYRGQDHHRRDLPTLIKRVEGELSAARSVLIEHDKRVRAAHLAAARKVAPEWQGYLKAVTSLLHYAEHREADLADVFGLLQNSVGIALVDRRVTSGDLADILIKARVVHSTLLAIWTEAPNVHLGPFVSKFEGKSWVMLLGQLGLKAPTPQNIGDWLDVAGSWASAAGSALEKLSMVTLDELLRAEKEVAELAAWSGDAPPPLPPEPPRVPLGYATLVVGKERPRQTKLSWVDRFFIADGLIPGTARFLCAGAIIGMIMIAGYWNGRATVHVVNGLNRPVEVQIGDDRLSLSSHAHADIGIDPSAHISIRAWTKEHELIESFDADASESYEYYVYNVAQSAPLLEVGSRSEPPKPLGAPRWTMTRAIRVVDVRANDASPYNEPRLTIGATDEPTPMLEAARGDAGALAAAHVRWDPPGTKNLETWFKAAEERPEFGELLAARIAVAPDELVPRLYELERGPRADVCARDRKLASEQPSSPTWQYLASRCIDDRAARDEAFVTLAARWPDDPWLMYMHGAVLADRGAFDDAEKLLAHATPRLPETSSRVMTLRARIARVTGSQLYDTLVDHDPLLERLRDFEQGNVDVRGNLLVYRLLDRGDLPSPKASFERGLTPMIFLLVACDDRATQVQINAGAVPPSKVFVDHAIYAYALALRTGRDPGPYRTLVTDAVPDLRQAFAFVDAVHAAAPGTLDQIPPPVGFIERAMAYAAATVRLGDATPPQWRTFAARALFAFVYERPSFRE